MSPLSGLWHLSIFCVQLAAWLECTSSESCLSRAARTADQTGPAWFGVQMVPVICGPFSLKLVEQHTDGPTTRCRPEEAGAFGGGRDPGDAGGGTSGRRDDADEHPWPGRSQVRERRLSRPQGRHGFALNVRTARRPHPCGGSTQKRESSLNIFTCYAMAVELVSYEVELQAHCGRRHERRLARIIHASPRRHGGHGETAGNSTL